MAYSKTIWVNGETAAGATNMNKIENELEALDTGKQNNLTAGDNISINENDEISVTGINIPTVVYNNSSGNNGDVTFTESISGAKEIEIVYFYSTTQKIYKSVRIPYTENMKISLDLHYYGIGSAVYFIFAYLIQISNSGITKINSYTMNFANSWSKPSIETTTDIYIEKVIVYK